MQNIIVAAIRARHQLEFVYSGESRIVEPYCYGYNHKGHSLLRAWQLYGMSPGWRLFDTSKITGLRDNGKVFAPSRAGYNPNDADIQSVIAHI